MILRGLHTEKFVKLLIMGNKILTIIKINLLEVILLLRL